MRVVWERNAVQRPPGEANAPGQRLLVEPVLILALASGAGSFSMCSLAEPPEHPSGLISAASVVQVQNKGQRCAAAGVRDSAEPQ